MADLFVETKLLPPRPRPQILSRPRLDDLMLGGSRRQLTLVAAPAGFGKTTLLASWLSDGRDADDEHVVAWVSLDEGDQDSASFWAYVLLALDRAVPGSGAAPLTLHQTGQASIESVLTSVVNELGVHAGEVTLVLDDYHLVDGVEVARGMSFLLDHLPPQLRIVIGTRADPALPLSRMRARGEVAEIRAADLRLTSEEVSTYLNELNGLDLTPHDVAALETRTEGWVAALQLAVLSLRNRHDRTTFIAGFNGTERFVVDYLVDEVLSQQAGDVRRFLLDTSILEQLTGPLCDAVSPPSTGSASRSGAATLETLERENLFLVPLDSHRSWYRYHHLFGDVLRAHLLQERADDVAGLHRRASGWYADAGHTEAAVRHALWAGDTARAADLVELNFRALGRERREDLTRRWAHELPTDVVRERPVLAVALIGGLMASNEFEDVGPRLDHVEVLLAKPRTEVVVVDPDELRRMPAAVLMYRAALALVGGDATGAVVVAKQAIAAAVDDDHLVAGAAAALSGLASWSLGDIVSAHASYTSAVPALRRAGHIADMLGCSIALADMELGLGHLGRAEHTLTSAVELSGSDAPPVASAIRGTADVLVGLSRLSWHRNDLDAAADHLRRSDAMGEAASLPQNPYRWHVGLARLRAAEGDLSTALDLLDEAERVYVADYFPEVEPVHAIRARVLVARGDLADARAWARQHQVALDDPLSYLHEYEHITLARLLLAEHATTGSRETLQDAVRLLDRLVSAAEAGQRTGAAIELQALRAVALHAGGMLDASLEALAHAIDLGRPDGWIRVFVDAGPAMGLLLRDLTSRDPHSRHLQQLVAATAVVETRPGDTPGAVEASGVELVDPLSGRELEVLRLLGSDLGGPAIARELFVSLNTVRTHTTHIYAKLGVNNRRAAVSRAHQLGLLSAAPRSPRQSHHVVTPGPLLDS